MFTFRLHMHRLYAVVSEGICTHKNPLPDTDYSFVSLYLNEINIEITG